MLLNKKSELDYEISKISDLFCYGLGSPSNQIRSDSFQGNSSFVRSAHSKQTRQMPSAFREVRPKTGERHEQG